MKSFNDYINFCTDEQLNRARKFGAPIGIQQDGDLVYNVPMNPRPTTQQMIGWLRKEKGLYVFVGINRANLGYKIATISEHFTHIFMGSDPFVNYDTYEKAELAAIDDVLDHLEKLNTQNQKRMRKKL